MPDTTFQIFAVILASVMLIIIVSAITTSIKERQKINWLRQQGVRIFATVTEIRSEKKTNTYYPPYDSSKGYQPPPRTQTWTVYSVIAQYRDPRTKQVRIFKSKALYSKPKHLDRGSTVSVLIDPNNVSRYYMEVSSR
ncbi:MAG TPA: hypothetical protein VEL31_23420 [Ktedonobacteraceae bacterium]|nr:hypothetical protein [Ktedonobacteraceae bacterium]